MKVCYLVNQYPKISHTFIRREIRALERQGVEVGRCSIRRAAGSLVDDEDRGEQQRTRVIVEEGIPHLLTAMVKRATRAPFRFSRALAMTVKIGWRSERGVLRHVAYLAEACVLLRWLKQSGYDHVHAHFGTNSTSVALLCNLLGGPSYSFTVHGPEEFDKPLMLGLRDKIEGAAFVVAISSFGRGQLFRFCDHQDWPKIHVVRCGLDPAFMNSDIPPLPERPRIVCVGRLARAKGHFLLIEAASRLAAEGYDFELRFVGDGELRPELEEQIDRAGLRDRVVITGWASSDEVRAEMRAARMLVVASFAEGLPVVIMEALAMGRSVLTTDVAGIPELVSEDCGWLIPAGSMERLLDGLRKALRTSDRELERMGRTGQARVRKMHDADKAATQLRRLFESCVSGIATQLSPATPVLKRPA
jgi:colanic acid/amylovoran biosynthesis glycosyltransferase